jgi:hypothetical protein
MCSYLIAWSSGVDAAFDGTSVLTSVYKADLFGRCSYTRTLRAFNECMNATPTLLLRLRKLGLA